MRDPAMNIVILHYHLNRGGVTQVVLNHLRGLNLAAGDAGEHLRVLILFGGRRDGVVDSSLDGLDALNIQLDAIPMLDYDRGIEPDGAVLATEIQQVLRRHGFLAGQTLLHIHNHSLGKNISLPVAIRQLAEQGFHVLLQIHDFAEDLRPDNYRRLSDALAAGGDPSLMLYPQAPQIHYAVLNGRDYGILRGADVYEDRLHLLPNTVGDFDALPNREAAREKLQKHFRIDAHARFVLYPVRGIRRKNVGEMLLRAAAAPAHTVFGITLPPQNPVENASYERWRSLATELQLPCRFDLGAAGGMTFTENLVAADLLLTTSVAEGFGMVFLEAWLAGRGLVGRDLPQITGDFRDAGLQLHGLNSQLLVPVDWFGRQELHRGLSAHYGRLLRDYGVDTVPPSEVNRRVATLLEHEHLDFALLDTSAQSHMIRRVCRNVSARDQLLAANPFLEPSLTRPPDASMIKQNAEIVRQTYSLEAGGRRLRDLYQTVLASPISSHLGALPSGQSILNAFLDIQRLHPMRWES